MTPAPVVISEVERLLYLKSLPLPRLDSRTLGRMAAHLSERTYSKGEVLQELNVMPTRFQVVGDGEVEILSGGGDTQTAVSRDLIGILSVMARDSRGLSAVARRKTLVLEGSPTSCCTRCRATTRWRAWPSSASAARSRGH